MATTLAAFASLGLPGLAGFVAEFQIFAGTFAVYPWLAGIGIVGILITAALFLRMVQQLFFGELPARWQEFKDLRGAERSEEHTSELQSLMRISYAVFCLKKKKQ